MRVFNLFLTSGKRGVESTWYGTFSSLQKAVDFVPNFKYRYPILYYGEEIFTKRLIMIMEINIDETDGFVAVYNERGEFVGP